MTNIIAYPNLTFFQAQSPSPISNVTGDGTVYTVILSSLINGSGAGYNTSTGIFTALVEGTYFFTSFFDISGLSASFTSCDTTLVTTQGSFVTTDYSPAAWRSQAATCGFNCFVMAPMAIGDTAYWTFKCSGGTKTVSFQTGSTMTVSRIF